ncbi:MAG TPA: 3-deoxy-D-manno-octulosonic acid transferase [Caulobacteraceae bacterium]|nr:3-deoxy-D-manno-octulosonic acid transferase [Caulobacteraceae bacterium]
MSLALSLYRAVTALAEPLAGGILRGRAGRGKEDAARIGERLGHASAPRPAGPLVWLHAASVGESVSLLPLIERLRAERPEVGVLVTSGTVTSAELLARRLPAGAVHQYAPVDGPGVARRFVDHWRPDLAVFVESELWPNLLAQASARGAKLALLSARITEDSARGWSRAPGAAKALLGRFDLILAQDRASEARLKALGGKTAGVANLKLVGRPLAADPAALAELKRAAGGRRIILAASTHPGEEEMIATVAPADALLVIAPRHPEHGEAVVEALRMMDLTTARRSTGEPLTAATRAYVADTLGEMGLLYALADVAVMGGSFAPGIGGHNPLEPARLGVPVITGPHVFNFAEVYEAMTAAGGAVMVEEPQALYTLLANLTPGSLNAMGETAKAFANAGAAALDETWSRLQPLLPR